jgi:substrate import-associated zinc metallohydrolase lipoprotein
MKALKLLWIVAALAMTVSCSEDKLDSNSIFEEEQVTSEKFDNWLYDNYVKTYNIDFKWQYIDSESNITYNLIPAKINSSIAMSMLMKYVWLDAFYEVAGSDFLRKYAPRLMIAIGSAAYDSQSTIVLGTAEGGLKVTLYNVNIIDPNETPFIDVDSPFSSPSSKDLNHWFFHTMHHEFTHILQQTKDYDPDFNLVTAATYRHTDWVNLKDADAPKTGFVTGYASDQPNEDFAEVLASYVTKSPEGWQKLLDAGVVTTSDGKRDTTGRDLILKKLDFVRVYMQASWGINLDHLRDVVVRRSREASMIPLVLPDNY